MHDRISPLQEQWARGLGARLNDLTTADVVVAVLPSGERRVVKGEIRLTAIVASGIARECRVTSVPVMDNDMADALRLVLNEQEERAND